MTNRGLLLEQARKKVNDAGYIYKKGKSRSKLLNTDEEFPTPKRKKITQEYRVARIAELQDKIKDLNERIEYKCKRRDAASNVRNYKECDELTEQMSNLKSEKRQLDTELSALTKKQKKSIWYSKRKDSGSQSSDAKSKVTKSKLSFKTTSLPQKTCTSVLSSSDSSSTRSISSRSTNAPSDILSSSSDQSESESDSTDHDTVILSDENLAEVSQPLNRQASHDHIPALKRTDRTPAATSVSEPQHFW